jgi:hypothetical protein
VKRLSGVVLAMSLIGAASAIAAQDQPWKASAAASGVSSAQTSKAQAVQYLFPEQVSVAAGKDAVINLHFKVNDGMHINSHTPRDKYLIATRLVVAEIPGMKIGPVEFPAGADYALAATPNDKLSVYTGEFVIHAHIQAAAGQHMFEGALRYQACDTNSCYPPRETPVAVDVIAK